MRKHYKRYPWDKFPYQVQLESWQGMLARKRAWLLEKHAEHPLVKSMLELFRLDAEKHSTMDKILDAVLPQLEKGLPLSSKDKTQEEATEEAASELQKLKDAGAMTGPGEPNDALRVSAREPLAALVIAMDGEFVRYSSCVGKDKNDLQYQDDLTRNLDDLTMAECFDSVEDAIAFCKKNCPVGWQVLANPCTRAEEIVFEKEEPCDDAK